MKNYEKLERTCNMVAFVISTIVVAMVAFVIGWCFYTHLGWDVIVPMIVVLGASSYLSHAMYEQWRYRI